MGGLQLIRVILRALYTLKITFPVDNIHNIEWKQGNVRKTEGKTVREGGGSLTNMTVSNCASIEFKILDAQ